MGISGSPSSPRPPFPVTGPTAPASAPVPEEAPAAEPAAREPAPAAPAANLWDVLTPAERALFMRKGGTASLTYGADGRPGNQVPVPTGRQIDIRG